MTKETEKTTKKDFENNLKKIQEDETKDWDFMEKEKEELSYNKETELKEEIEKKRLIKKIVGILADYKFNSTQISTAEMIVERIIGIVNQQGIQKALEIIKEILKSERVGETHYCSNKDCKYYNPKEKEDQNAWIIPKKDLKELTKKLNQKKKKC